MATILEQRRADTARRLTELKAQLADAEKEIEGRACVYMIGSGARGEMSSHSDVDLFIISSVEPGTDRTPSGTPRLSQLDTIELTADLIRANRHFEYRAFSDDGRFIKRSTTEELCRNLGTPDDDHANTFTARLLLLIESTPLLGREVYSAVIQEVIEAYWKDYEDHRDAFRPAFLMNDIVRLWKTFCVNYEANTKQQPDRERAKRKLQNYKLKNSRVVTCYSALLYLMQVYAEQRSVHPADVKAMTSQSPTMRLEWLMGRPGYQHRDTVSELLEHYGAFLERTNKAKEDLIKELMDEERAGELRASASKVGDAVAKLVLTFSDNELFRYLIV